MPQMQAYRAFVPVALHYRWVQWRLQRSPASSQEEADDVWLQMDLRYALPTVEALGVLQGMYTKYGQTSAGMTNTMSDTWIQQLRKLEDQVPPRSIEVVRQTIQEETGRPVEDTFSSFDPEPLGSASIGQVHRATLAGCGREVAVKVQYPDSGRLFRGDMAAIRTFFEWLAPEQLCVLDALEKQNALELDYHNEALNLIRVNNNMRSGWSLFPSDASHGPTAGPLFAVLLQQWLPGALQQNHPFVPTTLGPKLVEGLRQYGKIEAARQGTTLEAMEREMRARIESGDIAAKYEGPSAWQVAAYLALYRARDAGVNVLLRVYNLLARAVPVLQKVDLWHTTLPPNAPKIVDALMRIHGEQLLRDGFFNADPHGGNFLLLPDDRIGMIDYGACKELTHNERISICIQFVALMRNDVGMMMDMAKVGGFRSKYGKPETIEKLMQFGYNSWGKDVTGGKNLIEFMDELKANDPWEEVPDNFVMANFLTIRLRSLGLAMNYPIKCSDWWGPLAEKILKEEGVPYETWNLEKLIKNRPDMNMQ
eukprot:gene3563-670_t